MSTRPEPLIAETAPIHKRDIYRDFCQTHLAALRNWAEQNDISPRELAKLISVNSRTVAKWMTGKTVPIADREWAKIERFERQHPTAKGPGTSVEALQSGRLRVLLDEYPNNSA